VTLAHERVGSLVIARNDAGVRAIAWPMKLFVAPPGAGFGAPQDVPVPPRAPVIHDYTEPTRSFLDTSVAVAPNGSVLVGYEESDSNAGLQRAVAVLRRPDGSWTEPQILDDDAGAPQVVADAMGGLHALWATAAHTTTDGLRLYVADAGPDGQFGPGRLVSNPDWRSDGHLSVNRRGDLLVDWVGQPSGPVIGASYRPAGGDWQQPEVLYGGIPYGGWSSGALDDRGNSAIAWTNGDAWARSRPAGEGWGPVSSTFVRQGSLGPYRLAFEANGRALLVSSAARSEGTIDTIVASILPRGGSLQLVTTVSSGVNPLSVPELATDAFGNGLIVWLRGPLNEPSTVFASGYSATPPDLTAVAAKRNAFAFKVNEPARVTVTVSGRHRSAMQWSRVPRGKNTLPFNGKVRSLLARPGRYSATFRARDAGPRASRTRTIKFKR
jgi:hypothetical protein